MTINTYKEGSQSSVSLDLVYPPSIASTEWSLDSQNISEIQFINSNATDSGVRNVTSWCYFLVIKRLKCVRIEREREGEKEWSRAIIGRGVSNRSVGVIMVCGPERFWESTSLFWTDKKRRHFRYYGDGFAGKCVLVLRNRYGENRRRYATSNREISIKNGMIQGARTMSRSEQAFLVRRLVWKCDWTTVFLSILCVIPSNPTSAELYGGKDNQCPVECACLGNVVDCSSLQLIGAPSGLPPWTEILWVNSCSLFHQEYNSGGCHFVCNGSF